MAEAIATAAIAHLGGVGGAIRAFSAGVGAGDGAPMTDEAVQALRRLGIDPPPHRSVALNRDMIRKADVVFAMTQSHVRRILELDPSAGHKVRTLDPEGNDIPDPLGGPQGVYDDTARDLKRLIDARLKEMSP